MRIFGYVSPLLLVSMASAAALTALYRLTPLGREMLAAGAKAAAAELSGVRVGRTFVICHVLSGVLAGVAAIMVVARTGAAIPSMAGDLGQDWLLPAFLGPVLGGTLLAGGRVSVLGAFLGSVLVSELTNGLLQYRIGEFWVQTWLGLLLLLAVLLDLGAAQVSRADRGAWRDERRLCPFPAHRLVRPARDHRGRPRSASAIFDPVVPVAVQHPDPAARGGGELRSSRCRR